MAVELAPGGLAHAQCNLQLSLFSGEKPRHSGSHYRRSPKALVCFPMFTKLKACFSRYKEQLQTSRCSDKVDNGKHRLFGASKYVGVELLQQKLL